MAFETINIPATDSTESVHINSLPKNVWGMPILGYEDNGDAEEVSYTEILWMEEWSEIVSGLTLQRNCWECGEGFKPNRLTARFCSDSCARLFHGDFYDL